MEKYLKKAQGAVDTTEVQQIVVNQIMTPDGTIIQSRHRHDYVTHLDKNGLEYMVDGGEAYLRRTYHKTTYGFWDRMWIRLFFFLEQPVKDPLMYTEMSLYVGDSHEEIRRYVERGGRGVDGTEPLKYVVLCEISDIWLENLITYEEENRPNNRYLNTYRTEVQYRINNNIKIAE